MLFLNLLTWWFTKGWHQAAANTWRRMVRVADFFSVPILLRTLWAPWRRIVTYPGASLDAKIRALADNLVSRCIGFTVRFMVLVAAAVLIGLTAVFGVIYIGAWPLVPLLVLVCLMKGAGL